jgi:hypothetical protein
MKFAEKKRHSTPYPPKTNRSFKSFSPLPFYDGEDLWREEGKRESGCLKRYKLYSPLLLFHPLSTNLQI